MKKTKKVLTFSLGTLCALSTVFTTAFAADRGNSVSGEVDGNKYSMVVVIHENDKKATGQVNLNKSGYTTYVKVVGYYGSGSSKENTQSSTTGSNLETSVTVSSGYAFYEATTYGTISNSSGTTSRNVTVR